MSDVYRYTTVQIPSETDYTILIISDLQYCRSYYSHCVTGFGRCLHH